MHPKAYLRPQVARLPNRLQVAFAAGCAEHVLPLFELNRKSDRPRNALEVTWRYAFGGEVSFEELRLASESAHSVIPDIEEDPSEEASLSMSAAVTVMATLNAVKDGVPDPAVRAGTGAISTLSIAAQMLDPELEEDLNDIKEFQTPSRVSIRAFEEWKLQEEMLIHLGSGVASPVDQKWKEIHRQRGADILKWWQLSTKER